MPLLQTVTRAPAAYLWPQVIALSKRAVIATLSHIATGQLVITDVEANLTTVCGALEPQIPDDDPKAAGRAGRAGPRAELRVMRDLFWLRLLLFADMGFAESYMLGEVACDDLTSFFELFIVNRNELSNGTTLFSSVATLVSRIARSTNTLANARLNIAAHYDISNTMFAAFLSPDMTYSCPIWSPLSSVAGGSEPLEQAQMTKLQYFVDQIRLRSSDHVLEIGSGWGSFAMLAVRQTGCQVTTLTLSREQKALAEERIAAAGLSGHIDVLLCDYRSLPPPVKGHYDKVVSIEMLEAVGAEFLETYFSCVDRLLKPEGGIAAFQCITIPETRYEGYAKGNDFIRQYIFPGGHLPTVSQLVRSIDTGSQSRLMVDDIRNIGGHYAKTLRLWNNSFKQNFDKEIRPALLDEHAEMDEGEVEVFRHKWEYYFTYCEAGFRTKTLGDVIITVGREGATDMLNDIPL